MTERSLSRGPARRALGGAALLAAAIALIAAGRPDRGAPSAASPPAAERSSCWVLVDMDSFFCGSCLEHLLAFSRAVPARIQEDRVRGILILGAPGSPEAAGRRGQIVRAKWQGFSRANDIRFPAAVDADGAFAGPLKAGFGVLVFDARSAAVRGYPWPVPRGGIEEILRILVD